MRRLKKLFSILHTKCFVFCFGLLLSIFSVCVFFTSSSSALGATAAQTFEYSSGHLRFDNGAGGMVTKNLEVPNPSMGAVLQHFNTSSQINGGNGTLLGWTLQTNSTVPANSLISLYVQYEWYVSSWNTTVPPNVPYYGVQFANDKTLLWENCIGNSGQFSTTQVGSHTLSCTYLIYNSTPMTILDTLPKSRIIIWPLASNFDNSIRFSNGSYIQLTNDGLSSSDREWLEDVLQDNATDMSSVIAKLNEVKSEQQATTRAIQAQTQQQHDDYESEVEREEAKQEELEDQAGDLSLSASSTGNPFANMFNASGCVNMPIVGGWFGNPNLKVCSPYPATIANILNFVGSAIIVGFLIRIYYKHMNGGYQS